MTDRRPDRFVQRLAALVQGEAHRTLSEAQLAPDPARVADGWERRFITDADRLGEVVALYEAAGFEVTADPIRRADFPDGCDDCQLLGLSRFRTIYTRRRRPEPGAIEGDGSGAYRRATGARRRT
jgi:hypothetical protein